MTATETALILGLDLGVASIGWALVRVQRTGSESPWVPVGIERLGCRIFDPGTAGSLAQIAKGGDESRGVARRTARGMRRNIARRAARLSVLYRILSSSGLLPALPPGPELEFLRRDAALKALDQSLLDVDGRRADPDWAGKLPYRLRAAALGGRLEAYELGRALYHLAQRRGFRSNRKALPKADEKPGELEQEFQRTREALAGEASLGAWLAKQDPHAQRLRCRHHQRDMVEQEFGAIWQAQRNHHPVLDAPGFKHQVHRAIFFQRPLKSAAHLIGWCSLERGRWITFRNRQGKVRRVYRAPRRAPKAHPLAQRFRLLQKVNDLEVWYADGRKGRPTPEQRTALLAALMGGDLKVRDLKRILGLGHFDRINHLEEGDQKLPGDRTAEKLIPILGEARWQGLDDAARERLVRDCLQTEDPDQMTRLGQGRWGLDSEQACALAKVQLEQGYFDLSLKALRKLLPRMEAGEAYATARLAVYGPDVSAAPEDDLPPVPIAFPALRNPLVARTLTELRKVVNAILKRYGKPLAIRIELAREMKKSREQRKTLSQRIEARRKEREQAWAAVQQACTQAGIALPRGQKAAEEKWLLWEECGGICPYTGDPISFHQLFVSHDVEVEHIIPFQRSLDDSFQNKTLCFRSANQEKNDRLPTEAFGDETLATILQRVEQWDGKKAPAKQEKLRRFRLEAKGLDADFTSSQLNDTAYASRLAQQYVARLYGGLVDADKHRRIQASKGQLTATLRRAWGLEGLLGTQEGPKNREDHRHHALDALVIALTDPGTLHALSRASQRQGGGRLRIEALGDPWPGFVEETRERLGAVTVSFRQDKRKVNGRLHEATFYRRDSEGGVYAREAVENLSARDIPKIRNEGVRKAVESALARAGGLEPAKAFKDAANLPFIEGRDGRIYPIRKVVIQVSKSLIQVGQDDPTRYSPSDENHHLQVLAVTDAKGRTRWKGHVVTRMEALDRHRQGVPVVGHPEGFVMSLAKGDLLRWEEEGVARLFLVRTAYGEGNSHVKGHHPWDAREKAVIEKDKALIVKSLAQLAALRAEKVLVTPLGEVRRCRD